MTRYHIERMTPRGWSPLRMPGFDDLAEAIVEVGRSLANSGSGELRIVEVKREEVFKMGFE